MARKQHTPEKKAKLVLEVLRGEGLLMKLLPKITFIPICFPNGNGKLKQISSCSIRIILQISDSMEISFVLETRHAAIGKTTPEIMNSEQGSHFTSPQYTGVFLDTDARISMDHLGRAYENIFMPA